MKQLYIENYRGFKKSKSKKKYYIFLGVLLVLLWIASLVAPHMMTAHLRERISDNYGYHLNVGTLGLIMSKGQLEVSDVYAFDPKSKKKFLEINKATIDFKWKEIFKNEAHLDIVIDQAVFTFSEGALNEINRVKSQNNVKHSGLFMKEANIKSSKFTVYEYKKNDILNVIEFVNSDLTLKNMSTQAVTGPGLFKFQSNISSGGKFLLEGKINSEVDGSPWVLNGKLSEIPSTFFDRISRETPSFLIKDSKLDIDLIAESSPSKITGELITVVQEVKLVEENKKRTPKRKKAKENEDEGTEISVPFNVDQEISLELAPVTDKLKRIL